MNSRTERSRLKAEPLPPPGQSIRSAKIDLVLGRLMPMMWLTTVAATLTVITRLQQTLRVGTSLHWYVVL
jgi:hypothetical protein